MQAIAMLLEALLLVFHIIDLGEFLLPEKPETPDTTVVRIWSGMDSNKTNSASSSLGGRSPWVALFDERGDFLGKSEYGHGDTVKEANFIDLHVEGGERGNARAAYLALIAQSIDAICISAISVKYPDGTDVTIFGDIPTRYCGWTGYRSITDFPVEGYGSGGYRPFCFWLDENDSYNSDKSGPWSPQEHLPASVVFHLPDLIGQNETVEAYAADKDLVCKSQGRLQAYPDIIDQIAFFEPPLTYGPDGNYLDANFVVDSKVGEWAKSVNFWNESISERNVAPVSARPSMRTTRPRRDTESSPETQLDSHWVLSRGTTADHTATYFCSLPNMVGPSYASLLDRKFCKTDDHTLWDLCGGTITSNCFDMDSETLYGEGTAVLTIVSTDSAVDDTPSNVAPVLMKLSGRIDMEGSDM